MTALLRASAVTPTVASVAVRPRSLVVLAGLPGAGKTTLLGRLDAAEPVTVLDSDQVREWIQARISLPYRTYRLFVHLAHRFRVLWHALFSPGLLVVHEPSTRQGTRAMLLVMALLSGRPRHFLWLDASAAEALDGQIARHRMIRAHSFERHVRRADVMRDQFEAGWKPFGWPAVTVLTRAGTSGGLRLTV
ncbi:ATP-binding protein [Lentzea tibetensis]|uniref:ATP-binding protein n=1 Tax=Lentzea tibetensis TaxID=2591470 RepID=A0A563EFZ8_9PSEU|nr:AAA family ATPase [Lentzea tibetensis]TWP45120.1 ATP-binding protein [Lentzea tibetensis]